MNEALYATDTGDTDVRRAKAAGPWARTLWCGRGTLDDINTRTTVTAVGGGGYGRGRAGLRPRGLPFEMDGPAGDMRCVPGQGGAVWPEQEAWGSESWRLGSRRVPGARPGTSALARRVVRSPWRPVGRGRCRLAAFSGRSVWTGLRGAEVGAARPERVAGGGYRVGAVGPGGRGWAWDVGSQGDQLHLGGRFIFSRM